MDIDYQQKYFHLQSICKKQQKSIAKLQLQIRERCQSYLLHSSRHKNMHDTQQRANESNSYLSSPSIKLNNLQESIVETVDWANRAQDDGLLKSGFSGESAVSKKIAFNFTISSQIDISQTPSMLKESEAEEKKIDHEKIVLGFKQRIVRIQQQKNKYVKDIQKLNLQVNLSRKKAYQLQRKIELSAKQQKRVRLKMQQIEQVQATIIEIFQQLTKQLSGPNKFMQMDDFESKKMNNKLQQIYKLVKHRLAAYQKPEKLAQQDITQQYKQNLTSLRQDQFAIAKHLKQQERHCNLPHFSFSILNTLQMQILPNQQSRQVQNNSVASNPRQQFEEKVFKMLKQKEQQFQQDFQKIQQRFETQVIKNSQLFSLQILEIKKQLQKEKALVQAHKEQQNRLEQQNLSLITENMQKTNKLSNLQHLVYKLKRQAEQASLQKSKLEEQLKNMKSLQPDFQKTKIQLDKSRSIIDDLQSSKLAKQLRDMAQSRTIQKNATLKNSSFQIVQKLEQPYYVQEELQNDGDNEYVKRSFIRKKIVRRNLSATAYRVVSKSKEQVDQLIKSKMSKVSNKSLQKSQKLKQSSMKEQSKALLKEHRISQLSQENRDSDYFNNVEQIVKVVQVTTRTPREEIVTTKISSKNVEQSKSFRRKN